MENNSNNSNSNVLDNGVLEPKNYLDPKVYHDPSDELKETIVKIYTPQYDSAENQKNNLNNVDNKAYANERVDGIDIPVIKLNNTIIEMNNIYYFKIDSRGFTPRLTLTIIDYDNYIKSTDMPGMNNVINVYLSGTSNSVYKPISLNFYITNVSIYDNTITYTGIYKLFKLKNSLMKSIVHNGCSQCGTSQTYSLNTFEYLHDIALDCGLGFAATDHCKDINDRLERLLISQSYEDFIEEQIQFGGVDENSIFDCWVDFYNYIVLENVSWVLNENNDPRNLSIVAEQGLLSNDERDKELPVIEMVRTITNSNTIGITNLNIESYEEIVNNSDLIFNGNLKTVYYMTPEGNSGNNAIDIFQVQSMENSIDGKHIEDYQINGVPSFVFNFAPYNVNKQKIIRSYFFEKHRSKMLKVKLTKINLGLYRGMLVNVLIYEYDPLIKREIIYDSNNLGSENESIDMPDIDTSDMNGYNINDLIANTSVGFINTAKSDQYYIDGVEIEYNYNLQRIEQYLYLIKKGSHSNYNNKYTLPKINLSNK